MKKNTRVVMLALLVALVAPSCQPYVNYTPDSLDYARHAHQSTADTRVHFRERSPDQPYDAIGWGYVPQRFGYCCGCVSPLTAVYTCNFSVEEAVAALREEALKRGADAIVGVEVTQEARRVPAEGGFGIGKRGVSGYYHGEYETTVGFVQGTFVVWRH
jgi:hypothetical protein